jgi:nitrite reductase/ring-hydroxylating ferredoxin subunit
MLTKEDNELITRTGPGTIMGDLLREYWIPAVRSDELPGPDSPLLRVRLLGEDLIAFRATSGAVGIVANACPHRGASLFFGRNEEEGLRCVYHGWKFDTTGACVDMPSEPPESNFKSKVRVKAYPCVERGGVVWTYMGPRETPPPLPDLEPNMVPLGGEFRVQASMVEWNWVQAIENRMDTAHVAFLHYGSIPPEIARDREWSQANGDPEQIIQYIVADRAPTFVVRDTDFGCSYAAYRAADDETDYYRTAHFLFPFITMGPGTTKLGTGCRLVAVVPIDDKHTMEWSLSNVSNPATVGSRGGGGGGGLPLLPNTSDWLGRFRAAVSGATDYDIDREVQRDEQSERGFTGLANVPTQDRAISWSQGPLYDRSQEHLGTTDAMVIRVRRRLLEAAKALREHGTTPPGVDQPEVYRQRSGWAILPRGVDYWEYTRDMREAFSREQEAPAAISAQA